jgi:hypothetical protein
MNRRSCSDVTSRFKGVFWNKKAKKWQAGVKVDGILKYLGLWEIEEVAALAYDMVAIREFGEFTDLNFN